MNSLVPLSEASFHALGWMLLHFVWQGLAVAAILAGTRVVIKDSDLRYATACAALLAMVALPVSTFLTQDIEMSSGAGQLAGYWGGVSLVGEAPSPLPALPPDELAHRPTVASDMPGRLARLTATLQDHMPKIVLCWLAGVLLLCLRLLGGCWVSYRLRHTGTGPLPDKWRERVSELARGLGIRQKVEVLTSSVSAIPMVVWVFRPVILMPVSTLLGLTHAQLEAILVHELAHVRRYDNLVNLLQRLVETVFFFHPAVWWVSRCIRTEREHCCDDIATASSDPKLYAGALAALEELRIPVFASAATGGPLLSRVRRLLAPDRTGAKNGLSSFTVSFLVGILVVLTLAIVTLEATLNENQMEDKEMVSESNKMRSRKVLDIEPTKAFTRAAGALHDMLQAAGHSEWSTARLQGVLGNAFSFEMRKGAGVVWQEANLDWWLFLEILPELELGCRIQRFQARQRDEQGDFRALKAAAWEAVRASIDQGVPAVAWNPMSVEQAEAGLTARDWGLLVGYDKSDETYTVRHNYVHDGDFTVRYDAIGHTDPIELFCVLVYDHPEPVSTLSAHVKALQNAVAFGNGTRYDPKEPTYQVDARGFAAYELWREAIESGAAAPKHSHYHSGELRVLRGYAAAYLRELVDIFPVAASELGKAGAHYDHVVEASDRLHTLCSRANDAGGFTADTRVEASDLVTAALQAERDAIASIEAALALVDESQ